MFWSITQFIRNYKTEFLIIAFAFSISVFFTFENRHYGGDLMMSRLITVERLVDAGTWAHASPTDSTSFPLSIDRIKIGDSFYSSKPPLYPLIMAGEVFIIKKITGMAFFPHKKTYIRILTLLNQVSLYTLMLIRALRWLIQLDVSVWTRRFMLFILSFGVLSYGASVTIHNHPISAALIFIGFYLVWEIILGHKTSISSYLLTGLIAGFVFSNELTAGLFSVLMIVPLMYLNPKMGIISLLAALIPVVTSAWLFFHISGSILPFYLNSEFYHYPGSYWNNPVGMDSLQEPKWYYFFHCFLGHHGLFSMSPILLLPIPGFLSGLKSKIYPLPILFWATISGTFSIILYVIFRTQNYGGDVIGLRWFFPFLPIFAFMAFPFIEKLSVRKAGKILCVILLLLSLPSNLESMWKEVSVKGFWEHLWIKQSP